MEEKRRDFAPSSGAIQTGPERTSFYTSDCRLEERQKYLHRVYGSQFYGFKQPLNPNDWLSNEVRTR